MSYPRIVSSILILPTFLFVSGCWSTFSVRPDDLAPASDVKGNIKGVLTRGGEEISFDEAALIEGDSIRAEVDNQPYAIALDEVAMIKVRRFNTANTVVLSLVVVGMIVAIATYDWNWYKED